MFHCSLSLSVGGGIEEPSAYYQLLSYAHRQYSSTSCSPDDNHWRGFLCVCMCENCVRASCLFRLKYHGQRRGRKRGMCVMERVKEKHSFTLSWLVKHPPLSLVNTNFLRRMVQQRMVYQTMVARTTMTSNPFRPSIVYNKWWPMRWQRNLMLWWHSHCTIFILFATVMVSSIPIPQEFHFQKPHSPISILKSHFQTIRN